MRHVTFSHGCSAQVGLVDLRLPFLHEFHLLRGITAFATLVFAYGKRTEADKTFMGYGMLITKAKVLNVVTGRTMFFFYLVQAVSVCVCMCASCPGLKGG